MVSVIYSNFFIFVIILDIVHLKKKEKKHRFDPNFAYRICLI